MVSGSSQKLGLLACAGGLLAATGWVYLGVLSRLAERWSVDPEYSHGFLVPLFSLMLLWLRRQKIQVHAFRSSWWAVPLLVCGVGLRLGGLHFYFTWIEQCSLVLVLGAICLAIGGWSCLVWAWPGLAFLFFMIPLPGRLEGYLASPLQRIATVASTNVLQTLGFFAQAEGNVIVLRDVELGIVDACSGLRMLIVFFALSTAIAVIVQRSLLQRILIVLSAIPIALFCNILRITMTGVLYQAGAGKLANLVFHDLAGWLMIPMTLLLLGLELRFYSHLFIPAVALDEKQRGSTMLGALSQAPFHEQRAPARQVTMKSNGR